LGDCWDSRRLKMSVFRIGKRYITNKLKNIRGAALYAAGVGSALQKAFQDRQVDFL